MHSTRSMRVTNRRGYTPRVALAVVFAGLAVLVAIDVVYGPSTGTAGHRLLESVVLSACLLAAAVFALQAHYLAREAREMPSSPRPRRADARRAATCGSARTRIRRLSRT